VGSSPNPDALESGSVPAGTRCVGMEAGGAGVGDTYGGVKTASSTPCPPCRFLSFFLGFRRPKLITGLSGGQTPHSHLGLNNLSRFYTIHF